MDNVLNFPQTLFLNEHLIDEDDVAVFRKTFHHPKAISLEPEVKFYIKKFKRVFSVCESSSGKGFVLRVNDGVWSWEDGGEYVCKLKGESLEKALNDAISKYPKEVAFCVPHTSEHVSNNKEFDKFFESIDIFQTVKIEYLSLEEAHSLKEDSQLVLEVFDNSKNKKDKASLAKAMEKMNKWQYNKKGQVRRGLGSRENNIKHIIKSCKEPLFYEGEEAFWGLKYNDFKVLFSYSDSGLKVQVERGAKAGITCKYLRWLCSRLEY